MASARNLSLGFLLCAGLALGARVSLDVGEHDLLDESEAAWGKPAFRLAGVPIYGAPPQPKMRLAPGQPEPTREWIVILKSDSTDSEVESICEGNRSTCFEGHPSAGGLPFADVSLSDGGLEAVLAKHPGRVAFVEADLPLSIVHEVGMPRGLAEAMDDSSFMEEGSEEASPDSLDAGVAEGSFLESESASAGAQHGGRAGFPWGIVRTGADKRRLLGKGVHVYVLDTGIRVTHKEFGGRAFPALETFQRRAKECDPNDHEPRHCAYDPNGHGTHCAGTIAGETMGVANGATVHGVKVFGADGSGSTAAIMGAIDWITRRKGSPEHAHEPTVMSMSLSGKGRMNAYKLAVDNAVTRGITVVVAAGNDNDDACGYSPAFLPSAITVGATTNRDTRSDFSSYGSCVDIFAPGSDIQSASHLSDNGYAVMSGTSMACPHVAGAVARILEQRPDWKSDSILKELQRTGTRGAIGDVRGSKNLFLKVDVGLDPEAPGGEDEQAGGGGSPRVTYDGFVDEQSRASPPKWITVQSFSGIHGIVVAHAMTWGPAANRPVKTGQLKDVRLWINAQQTRGLSLISLKKAGIDRWAAVMAPSARCGVSEVAYNKVHFLVKDMAIKNEKQRGRHIISVEMGPNGWWFVFGKTSEILGQTFVLADWNGINMFIQKALRKQYFVTEIAVLGPHYFCVVSRISTFVTQTVQWVSEDNVESLIKQKTSEGLQVTSVLDNRKGQPDLPYLVVFSKVLNSKLFPNSNTAYAFTHGILG